MARLNEKRSAQSIIDTVIEENNKGLYVVYGFTITLFFIGILSTIYMFIHGDYISTVPAVLSSAMFIPALKWTFTVRRENIALRLLEAPLSHSDTAKEASEALYHHFINISNTEPSNIKQPRRSKVIHQMEEELD